MNEADMESVFQEFERQSALESQHIAKVREAARGILRPEVIREHVNKKQGIVLAYGMSGQIKFGLKDLKRFLSTIDEFENRSYMGKSSEHGIPYRKLFYASRPVDIERSRDVKNATFYQRAGNILFFRVTGNAQPFYRVQIRLEEWNNYIAKATPAFMAVKAILEGRISFECPCGRHQYWYRYMATLGNYAIEPLEHGFPKIRNRGLWGCCCKHVLKVLKELSSNRLVLLLCRELEKERNKSGFSSSTQVSPLSNEELRIASAKRLLRSASAAFKKYQAEADALKTKMKPRNARGAAPLPKVGKAFLSQLEAFLKVGRMSSQAVLDEVLNNFAKVNNMTREQIDGLIRKHNL